MVSKKYFYIEFLRFIFTLSIIYYHLVPTLLVISPNDTLLALDASRKYIGNLVECFFIIGGFFLYKSCFNTAPKSILSFAVSRFVRLWPMLAFTNIISFLFLEQSLVETLYNVFLLKSTGLSFSYKGYDWFVAPFFWANIGVYALLKNLPKQTAGSVLLLLAYIGYSLNINTTSGIMGREVVFNSLSLGMLRALSGVSTGALIAMISARINWHVLLKSKSFIMYRITITITEIASGILFVAYIYGVLQTNNIFIAVVLFCIFFMCVISRMSYLSETLNKKVLGVFGKYTYSIYLSQTLGFKLLAETIWRNGAFVAEHSLRCILVSIVLLIALGVLNYYIVEYPADKIYKKLKRSLFCNCSYAKKSGV